MAKKIVNKTLLKLIAGISTVILIPAIIIGGYFGLSGGLYLKFYKNPMSASNISFINAYKASVDNGAEIILTPGFNHQIPILETFQSYQRQFQDTGFALLDSTVSKNDAAASNTWSITFRADLGSFRTGVAACYFLNANQNYFLKNDNELNYGMYGGLGISSVTSFMGGFQHGVKWFNDNIANKQNIPQKNEPSSKLAQTVKEYIPPSWNSENFSGGFGPSDGSSIISAYLKENKLDLFMPVAGPQIWAAQSEIQKTNSRTFLIGVDSAVEDDKQNKNAPDKIGNGKYVQFSSMKKLDVAVETVLDIINNGNTIEGLPADPTRPNKYSNFIGPDKVGGFGTNAVGDIKNGCVGVSPAGEDYYKEALKLVHATIDDPNTDPSYSAKYSQADQMIYKWKGSQPQEYSYGDEFGLMLEFEDLKPANRLNKKNFLDETDSKKEDKLKMVLSSPTSVLMDGSFSQACYVGMYNWFKKNDVSIPPPPGARK